MDREAQAQAWAGVGARLEVRRERVLVFAGGRYDYVRRRAADQRSIDEV